MSIVAPTAELTIDQVLLPLPPVVGLFPPPPPPPLAGLFVTFVVLIVPPVIDIPPTFTVEPNNEISFPLIELTCKSRVDRYFALNKLCPDKSTLLVAGKLAHRAAPPPATMLLISVCKVLLAVVA